MRLFVAIALPAAAAGELDSAVAPLRLAWPELRWTGRDAWHLTLAFLGEVDEELTGKLGDRLKRAAARHPRLSLALGGAGAFPAAARARVLWTGVKGDLDGLGRLAQTVAAGARRAGVPPTTEGRRYEPHLTLARCRAPADVQTLVATLGGFAGTPWTAGEIYLIRSRLQDQPRYETLGAWPLLAPAPSQPA
jgi:RNA 2',3'-cyclic 3'-phosphodiesterase